MPRALMVSCGGATAAALSSPPEHGTVSDVHTDWYGLHFTLRPTADAPRHDRAVFTITGHEGTVEQTVLIENIPISENSPPICDGDRVSQRSDGAAAVDVYMHPYCRDPDGDDFVVYGGGPGVHPSSPKPVPAGSSESNWPYRTATFAGTETAPIWAVDALGARSTDAQLEVTVGPGVDSPPVCRPNPSSWTADGVAPIRARPGAVRRFGIICEDADADPFSPTLSTPPARGTIATLASEPQYGFWGGQRWVDATYVPADESLEPDPFSVTASGATGDGPAARMAIVPVGLPENHGGGCGYSAAQVTMDVPGTIELQCDDSEGDQLSAEVVDGPLHGTTGPAAVVPALYGWSTISIPYVPDPGHLGYDCVKVVVTDGHGSSMKLTIDIHVSRPSVSAPPVRPPPLPDVTTAPLPSPPVPPSAPGIDPARALAFAQGALGTRAVKRVPAPGGTEVWAPKSLSKRTLLLRRRAPNLFVLCRARCTVRSTSKLLTRRRARSRLTRRKTVAAATPDAARILWLTIDAAERRALRRTRAARVQLDVGVRTGAARGAPVRRYIRVTGR